MAAPRATITEDLTAQVDGVVTSFSVAGGPFIAGTLNVEVDGQRLRAGAAFDFEETSATTFDTCFVVRAGQTLLVQFEIEDLGAGFPLVVASGRGDC